MWSACDILLLFVTICYIIVLFIIMHWHYICIYLAVPWQFTYENMWPWPLYYIPYLGKPPTLAGGHKCFYTPFVRIGYKYHGSNHYLGILLGFRLYPSLAAWLCMPLLFILFLSALKYKYTPPHGPTLPPTVRILDPTPGLQYFSTPVSTNTPTWAYPSTNLAVFWTPTPGLQYFM